MAAATSDTARTGKPVTSSPPIAPTAPPTAALERTPPELSADIVDKGMVLTGGGAQLRNLDLLLREQTGLPVTVCDNPECAVVLGTGKALDELKLLRQIAIQ